jgi:anaerobic ribonucleoside-triphosphate reductase
MVEKEQRQDHGCVGEEPTEVKVPCEVYSRIVGYLRPVQAWNQGKQQEFAERTMFRVDASEEADA